MWRKAPWVRLLFLLAFIVMLFFLPTREFLKITCMLGIPFIFLLRFTGQKIRYSAPWVVCVFFLLVLIGVYFNSLYHLPEKIQIRTIITQGAALAANGQFNSAIAEYEKLESLGQTEKAREKISQVRLEQKASIQLEEAKENLKNGDKESAEKLIRSLPEGTRASIEGHRLLKEFDD